LEKGEESEHEEKISIEKSELEKKSSMEE